MPIASWPVGLPSRPLKSGFSDAEQHRVPAVAQVEDGPDLMRIQSQTVIARVAYPLYFTHAQYGTFKVFVINDLAQATAHFTMPVFVAPSTFENRRVYIDGAKWPAQPYRLGWIVNLTLAIFPTV